MRLWGGRVFWFRRLETRFARLFHPTTPDEIGGLSECINPEGELRTLPCHEPGRDGGGMDGFYAARLRRRSI